MLKSCYSCHKLYSLGVYCSWGFFACFYVMFFESHILEENSVKLDNINLSVESLSIFCWYYKMIF